MLSSDELTRFSHPRTLQRARRIAESASDIMTKRCSYNENETTLSAFVASSSGWSDRYRSQVTFEEDSDTIVDYFCTCPAYREYDGLCKHCAALVIAYQNDPESFFGYKQQRRTDTSAAIMEFMQQSQRAAQPEQCGTVDLTPSLSYAYHAWSASFHIASAGASYVLPDIDEFAARVRNAEHFAYGKKLAFTHSIDRFTPHAAVLIDVIDRAVGVRGQIADVSSWRTPTRSTKNRTLDVTEAELIELLDANGTAPLTIHGGDYSVPALTHVSVEHADPDLTIDVVKSKWQGFSVEPPENVVVIAHGHRSYVWADEVLYRCSDHFSRAASFLKNLCEADEHHLFINDDDMPLFCATALPVVEDVMTLDLPEEADIFKPVPCVMEFYFDRREKGVTCQATAVYGSRRFDLFPAFDETAENPSGSVGAVKAAKRHRARVEAAAATTQASTTQGPLRDTITEDRARHLVEHYFDLPSPFIAIDDGEALGNLLFGGLKLFQALGEVFTTPSFDRLISDRKPRFSLGVSLAGNLVDLDISVDDVSSDELTGILASYRERRHFHRLTDGSFIDIAEMDLAQLDRLSRDLDITPEQLASGTIELPGFRAFYLDEELDDDAKSDSFETYVQTLRHASARPHRLPAALHADLRPYQVEGFHWMCALHDLGLGGILADEMGLGKSVQFIAFLLAHAKEAKRTGPSLVACPASLVYNWTAEFERFAPTLKVVAVAGTKAERIAARARECDVMITSYDLLRIDSKAYEQREFFCFTLDEAQFIKNHATLTTRAVKKVRAKQRFALSGTPMENRLSELWSIFDFLMPGLLGSYPRFRETFELDIIGNDEQTIRSLQRLVGPFMLRRLKREVLDDLPDKLESVIYAPLGKEQHRLYAAREQHIRTTLNAQHARDFKGNKVEILAELTKLRQICCDPGLLYENYRGGSAKLDTIMDLVEQAMDAGDKTLVFSQFTSFLDRIAARLDANDVPYYTITGATRKIRRMELVDAFNSDDTPVFLISLKAGGTGLNLTGASVVIHADPWWNAAAQDQATDRAHRIGQRNVVSVQKVIAKGTIEERILKLQEAKSDLANQIVGGNAVSLSKLSRDDLLELLEESR